MVSFEKLQYFMGQRLEDEEPLFLKISSNLNLFYPITDYCVDR